MKLKNGKASMASTNKSTAPAKLAKKSSKSSAGSSKSSASLNAKFPTLKLSAGSHVALVYRGHTEKAMAAAKEVVPWLAERGFHVWTAPDQKVLSGTKQIKSDAELEKIALVIVLGGDGTYLRAVRLFNGRQTPIVAFNMGSLGFLTIHSGDEIQTVLEDVLASRMNLCPRSMLLAEIYRRDKLLGSFHALNDIVIERGSYSQLINTAIYQGSFLVNEVKADGIIISSPTGSTAYNLAAGGPIMDPDVKAIVITPVAPHSLTSRPLILPEDKDLSFKLEGMGQKAHFVVDGQKQMEIAQNDVVRIRKSPYDHLVVRSPSHNYFRLLRDKLKFGDRN
ncbi:MAG: NAD(+)/NADH kinase [Bdellovibrionota bacterium]